jgi:hypothetical protein
MQLDARLAQRAQAFEFGGVDTDHMLTARCERKRRRGPGAREADHEVRTLRDLRPPAHLQPRLWR